MGQCNNKSNVKCLKCGAIVSKNHQKDLKAALQSHECIFEKSFFLDSNNLENFTNTSAESMIKIETNSGKTINKKIFLQTKNSILKLEQEDESNYSQNSPRRQKLKEKLYNFRLKLQKLKKKWEHGYQLIEVDSQNIIQSSFESLTKANMLKDFKIQFKGECAQDAGGGLLREWMHLCIKQIMSNQFGLFKLTNAEQTSYRLVWSNNLSDETSVKALTVLGLIISKALLENISLNCPLNYTILRQLCSQPIHLSDISNYDIDFYRSWKNILKMSEVEELQLDSSIQHQLPDGDTEEIQLFSFGKNIPITNQNKQQYISQLINLFCSKSIRSELDQLFNTITSVIPNQYFSVFQPCELQMIITGPKIIDIEDWINNTVYDCYEQDDEVIQWFWQIVRGYDQDGFKNLLHYCTGSTRVPVLGFSRLQTSNGHVKKFSIRKIPLEQNNPYPKSYTCFNRLDLPHYKSKQEMKQNIKFIMEEEFNYFGLY